MNWFKKKNDFAELQVKTAIKRLRLKAGDIVVWKIGHMDEQMILECKAFIESSASENILPNNISFIMVKDSLDEISVLTDEQLNSIGLQRNDRS